jgi:S-formylglutathione hydrolase FrmB
VDFDIVYRRDLPVVLDELAKHGSSVPTFLEQLRKADKIQGKQMHVLMILAMAATYDPDPGSPMGVRLPLDAHTGQLDEQRWARWLAHDPLTLVARPECIASLHKLKALYIDCGSRDQYFIHYGTRAFVKRLEQAEVPHRYEEFDDDHSNIDYRMDHSLPYLYAAVAGS